MKVELIFYVTGKDLHVSMWCVQSHVSLCFKKGAKQNIA